MIETPGISVENPQHIVEIEGQSLVHFLAYLFQHRTNLSRSVQVLLTLDPDGVNEPLSGLRGNLFAMGAGLDLLVAQLLRIATDQGLQINLSGSPIVPNKFSN